VYLRLRVSKMESATNRILWCLCHELQQRLPNAQQNAGTLCRFADSQRSPTRVTHTDRKTKLLECSQNPWPVNTNSRLPEHMS
jgi:hypothetical protein